MDLVAAFKELGVDDPEGWAQSQTEEGIDQLSRATALRALADTAARAPLLVEAMAEDPRATAEVRASAQRLREMGVPQEDLNRVLKAAVAETMFEVCALFDGSAEPEINPGNVKFGAFSVKEVGDDFVPGDDLGLHEDWLQFAANSLGDDVVTR